MTRSAKNTGNIASLNLEDPSEPTPMVVRVTDIRPYDRNPRCERNAAYNEIHAAIRAKRGLDAALTITRRPAEISRPYMAKACNTRLQILQSLYAETGDEDYKKVNCLFIPWVSETEMTTAHLIENDARGSLIFIDRARAIYELKDMLEAQAGERLSQRQLVEALKQQGYELNQSMITPIEYAVKQLLPLIPKALRNGAGRPQINRIRRLSSAIVGLLEARDETAHADEAREWFHNCLAQYDSSSWLLEPVEQELVAYLADLCDDSVSRIRLDLDRWLDGGLELAPPAPSSHPLGREARNDEFHRDTKAAPQTATGSSRATLYPLARKLAGLCDIAECVLPVDFGAGYVVDLPAAPFSSNAPGLAESVSVWWLLSSLSGQWRRHIATCLMPLTADTLRIRPALLASTADDITRAQALVARHVGEPISLLEFMEHAFTLLEEDEFKLVLRLIKTRRRFHPENDIRTFEDTA